MRLRRNWRQLIKRVGFRLPPNNRSRLGGSRAAFGPALVLVVAAA